MERRRAILDPHLRRQLRRRRRHGHPDGVPVRHQLGQLLPLCRRGRRPHPGDGRPVRVLPGVELPRAPGLRRAAPRSARALPRRSGPVRRELAVRLLHHLHQRVHAAPGGARRRRRRHPAARRLLGLSAQPVGPRAVRAQHGGQRRHGLLRGGGGRRLLRARAPPCRPRGAVSPARSHRGPRVERAGRVPDGRPAGEARRPSPAGGAGGDGGPLRERDRGRHRGDRPAQRQGAASRQPDRDSAASSASSRTGRSTRT